MGYQDITVGDKVGKPVNARFIKSKNGTIGLEVAFDFVEPTTDQIERQNWIGWLSAKAIENTMDTLVNVLGFNGNDLCDEEGVLLDKGALAYGKEVRLVIEIEQYNQKTYPKIKWVNRLGGSAFDGVAPEVVKLDLQAVGFKGAFLAAKQMSDTTTAKEGFKPPF